MNRQTDILTHRQTQKENRQVTIDRQIQTNIQITKMMDGLMDR